MRNDTYVELERIANKAGRDRMTTTPMDIDASRTLHLSFWDSFY